MENRSRDRSPGLERKAQRGEGGRGEPRKRRTLCREKIVSRRRATRAEFQIHVIRIYEAPGREGGRAGGGSETRGNARRVSHPRLYSFDKTYGDLLKMESGAAARLR